MTCEFASYDHTGRVDVWLEQLDMINYASKSERK